MGTQTPTTWAFGTFYHIDIFKLVHLGLCEQTDMTENISFPQTTYAGGNKLKFNYKE